MDKNTELPSPAPGLATDPVCGMQVRIEGAEHTVDYQGQTYYFCGRGCRLEFQDDPARFFDADYVASM